MKTISDRRPFGTTEAAFRFFADDVDLNEGFDWLACRPADLVDGIREATAVQ